MFRPALIALGSVALVLFFAVSPALGVVVDPALSWEDYPYIVGRIAVRGFVTQIVVPSGKPHILFAIASPNGPAKAGEQYGLYVYDISDPVKPHQLANYNVEYPMYLAVTPDGSTAFLLNTWFQGQDSNREYGIHILDVSTPADPRRLGFLAADAFKAHVTQNGRLLLFEERRLKSESKKGLQLYDVSVPREPRPVGLIEGLPAIIYGLTTTFDGRTLIVRDATERIHIFNLDNPASPRKLLEQSIKRFGSNLVARGRSIYSDESLKFAVYDVKDSIKEVATLQSAGSGRPFFVSEDERTVLLPTLEGVKHLDITNRAAPRESARYPLPAHVGSVVPVKRDGHEFFLVGLNGAIVTVDPALFGTNVALLVRAHDRALALYNSQSEKGDYRRAQKAWALLEAAGIQAALKKRPKGMSERQYAYILNDYGYFMMQSRPRLSEAIAVLRIATKIDPRRALAYLNLGDALRTSLGQGKSYKEKVAATKKIKRAYLTYKKLSGKTTELIESFLRLNLVDTPPSSVCDYVATTVNAGRFDEVFGSVTSIDIDEDGSPERIEINYEGTAHYPSLTIYEGKDDAAHTSVIEEEGLWADFIGLVPFKNEIFTLHYNMGGYPIFLTSIFHGFSEQLVCKFVNEPQEAAGEESEDKPFCKAILADGHPAYVPFTEEHSFESSDLSETGVGKAALLDVDNDGHEEPIVELHYSSGAGPGCGYDYFDVLNSDRTGPADSLVRGLILSMQQVGSASRHPVPRCRGNTTGWFRLNGRMYFETKFPGNAPIDASTAFHEVFYVQDQRIHKTCEFVFGLKTRVSD